MDRTDVEKTLAFDESQLELVDSINIAATPASHLELLEQNPNDALLGPFANNEANTRTLKTRRVAFIPFFLMPAFLDLDLTP